MNEWLLNCYEHDDSPILVKLCYEPDANVERDQLHEFPEVFYIVRFNKDFSLKQDNWQNQVVVDNDWEMFLEYVL